MFIASNDKALLDSFVRDFQTFPSGHVVFCISIVNEGETLLLFVVVRCLFFTD